MPAFLHSLATAVPRNAYSQERALEVMKAWHGHERRVSRLLDGIYRASAIATRHSVVDDFQEGANGGFFYDPESETFRNPSTGERNALYAREAGALASCAATKVLATAGSAPAREVTHLITVSCTGFYAPGVDLELVRDLGLSEHVERYHIGFMGCYAAFPALRMARSICLAHEDATVLIVAVELCSVHLQAAAGTDELLAASVFADGAAAALVTARAPAGRSFRLASFATSLAAGARDDMAWTIGDSGFRMALSSRIPKVVEAEVGAALAPLWEGAGLTADDMGGWAVHPGGRAILDSFEAALSLTDGALQSSREVLANYGNMSSATVLFVLERLLRSGVVDKGPVTAAAFGPGLTVESALLYPQ